MLQNKLLELMLDKAFLIDEIETISCKCNEVPASKFEELGKLIYEISKINKVINRENKNIFDEN